ncbi:MAG: hypothetical protein JKY33_09750 [Bacteroidia bacterium]|nr:hypothetical protein [Bacteroidia bacterium]
MKNQLTIYVLGDDTMNVDVLEHNLKSATNHKLHIFTESIILFNYINLNHDMIKKGVMDLFNKYYNILEKLKKLIHNVQNEHIKLNLIYSLIKS